MRFPMRGGETVTVLSYTEGALDAHRNPVITYEPGENYEGCAVAPTNSSEQSEPGRDAVITGYTIYGPPGMVLKFRDRVRVRGDTFTVKGEVAEWVNPYTGVYEGVQFAIERIRG